MVSAVQKRLVVSQALPSGLYAERWSKWFSQLSGVNLRKTRQGMPGLGLVVYKPAQLHCSIWL